VVSTILGLLSIWDRFRGGVKVELFQATSVEPDNLHVVFRIRNTDDRSTSLRRAYHEWGPWSRFLYRLLTNFTHQELELRECDATAVYDMMMDPQSKSQLESVGAPVKLPLPILAGETKNFHTFLQKQDPEDRHHLVLFTTHKTYAKRLWSKLFEEGYKYVIAGVFTE
jgi:hypothetical protein